MIHRHSILTAVESHQKAGLVSLCSGRNQTQCRFGRPTVSLKRAHAQARTHECTHTPTQNENKERNESETKYSKEAGQEDS